MARAWQMCGGAARTSKRSDGNFAPVLGLAFFVRRERSFVRTLRVKRGFKGSALSCGDPTVDYGLFHKRPFLAHAKRTLGAGLATRNNDDAKPCFKTNDAKLNDLAGYETWVAQGARERARAGQVPHSRLRGLRSEMSGKRGPRRSIRPDCKGHRGRASASRQAGQSSFDCS